MVGAQYAKSASKRLRSKNTNHGMNPRVKLNFIMIMESIKGDKQCLTLLY